LYSVDEIASQTFITLVRTNGSLGPIAAEFEAVDAAPGGPGTALAGNDYESTSYFPLWIRGHSLDREYSAGFMGPNNNAFSTNRFWTDFTIYGFPLRPGIRYRNYAEDDIFLNIFDDNM